MPRNTGGTFWSLLLASLLACLAAMPASAGSGAIFTTNSTGTIVNGNLYNNKCDVYLDGGPGPNAPVGAAGLPDGDYFFQVTDPSGQTLLSTDTVAHRQFHVAGGFITGTSGSGNHPTAVDADHGSLGARVIQLCPFSTTPNPGGVYKVWVTLIGDYGPGRFFGFVPANSKTDNFKVKTGGQPTACLSVDKYNDTTGNFVKDPTDTVIPSWPLTVTDPMGAQIGGTLFTPVQLCNLLPGTYTVTESLNVSPFHWSVDWVLLDGVPQPATTTVLVSIGKVDRILLFGNGL
jgi:hypothetical protein